MIPPRQELGVRQSFRRHGPPRRKPGKDHVGFADESRGHPELVLEHDRAERNVQSA
jgi:hypothetical protein